MYRAACGFLRAAHSAGAVTIGNGRLARAIGNEVRCVGMFDRSAGCIVELARLRVGEIVRCEHGCRCRECNGGQRRKCNFPKHTYSPSFYMIYDYALKVIKLQV
mgnify:CR=1 FL=1